MENESRGEVRAACTLTFGEIRPFVSLIDRISILSDDLSCENYPSMRTVPTGAIDSRLVKGIGKVTVEFDKDSDPYYPIGALGELSGGRFLADAIEFWLGDEREVGELDGIASGIRSLAVELARLAEVEKDGERARWLNIVAEDLGSALDDVNEAMKEA